MCDHINDCSNVKRANEQAQKSKLVSYWSMVSGIVALIISMAIFYANTLNASEQVKDHESRIRSVEKTVTSNEVLLRQISAQLSSISNKLDKHIEYNNK